MIWQMHIFTSTLWKHAGAPIQSLAGIFHFVSERPEGMLCLSLPARDDVTPSTFSFQPWWQRRGKIMGSPETCWDKIKSSISALWSEKPLPAWAANKAAVNLELFRESPKRFNKSPLVSVIIPYCLAHELSHFLLLVNKHATLCHGFKFI